MPCHTIQYNTLLVLPPRILKTNFPFNINLNLVSITIFSQYPKKLIKSMPTKKEMAKK